jgi:protein O-mannosyl-transferase
MERMAKATAKTKRAESSKPSTGRRSWYQRAHDARLPLILCGLAFLIYSRSLFCDFVRDDFPQIVNNRQVQSWEYLPQLLTSNLWSQVRNDLVHYYRPLFSVWMLLVHTCGELTPWFWHLSSILLHLVATWLVFSFCRRLTGSGVGAVAGAAIFAVHPIHVDAVTWISASCEVLFTIFVLVAMLSLLPKDNDPNSAPRVWLSALCFTAGLFAKETAMVMLAILPVMAWLRLKDRATGRSRLWHAGFPYASVAAVYLLVRWSVLHRVGVETGEHNWAEVIFSAPSILLFYMKKLSFPWNLGGSYVNPLTSSATAVFWLQLAVVVIGISAVAWFAIRCSSLFGLAAALIVIPVLPGLAVIRIYQQGDMTHDRYLYLPSVGFALLVAMLVKKAWSWERPAKTAAIAAVVAVLAAFSVETISAQRYYQNDIAFYSRVIEVSPSDAYAMAMLGNVYLDQKRNDLALEEFRRANQISPQNRSLTLFLARGLFVTGNYGEAETLLKGLLQNSEVDSPQRLGMLLSLANVEISLGNLSYAQQLLTEIEHADETFPELHWALGVLYQRQGLLPQALSEYEKEFEITGDELAHQRALSVANLIQSRSAGRFPSGSGSR